MKAWEGKPWPYWLTKALIGNYADLYELKKEQILPLERMAEKSAEILLRGLKIQSKSLLKECLFALGIRYVGETVAKKLAKHFKTITKLEVSFQRGSGKR